MTTIDPAMKEIMDEFCKESLDLFKELDVVLDQLEQSPLNNIQFEKFGQIIDRVMGASKSVGATDIATFCELGKVIGYKSSQIKDEPLLTVVVAVLFDAVDLLKKMISKIQTGVPGGLNGLNTQAFVKRLKWLSDKFQHIDRSSCSYDKKGVGSDAKNNLSQNSIDDLMKSLGL